MEKYTSELINKVIDCFFFLICNLWAIAFVISYIFGHRFSIIILFLSFIINLIIFTNEEKYSDSNNTL